MTNHRSSWSLHCRVAARDAVLVGLEDRVRVCQKCKKTTVPESVWETLRPEQREGLRPYHARGFCQTCYKDEIKSGRLAVVFTRSPDKCVVCKKPMIPGARFYAMPKVERQGLVAHAAHGRCGRCNYAVRRSMKDAPELESLPDDKVPVEHLAVRQLLRHGRKAARARRVQERLARGVRR